MLDVPWSWEPLSIYGLQVIATLLEVMDDLVGSLPCGAEFPLGRVFGCWGDFAQDKVSYVKSFELHPPVVILDNLLLVLCHLMRNSFSNLVYAIQVDS